MRIGVFVGVVRKATSGGGTTLLTSIIDALATVSARHEFVIIEPDYLENSSSNLRSAARRLRRLTRKLPGSISFEEQCLRRVEADIVWFLSPSNKPVPVPYITTVWDLEHRRQPYFPEVSTTRGKWREWDEREHIFKTLLPRAARIISGTHAGKKEIETFYGVAPENVRVVPFPAADAFRREAGDSYVNVREKYGISDAFIFYPAQFWPHKNHINLLLALRQYNETAARPLHLLLTGSDKGNLSYVREMIDNLGLASHVRILGFVPQEDLAGFYREAEALVYPSFFGPDNLPPLEAFAIGCPVAAAKVPGAEEQFGNAAILFDPANPTAIADAFGRICSSQELCADLVQRGQEQVALRTPQRYVQQICDILDELEPMRRCWK